MGERRATYFIDVDGVIFHHHGNGASRQWHTTPKGLLPGVREFFDVIEKDSSIIVLCTARRESCRRELIQQLETHGIFYDHLIMGCGNGPRVVINDVKPGVEWPAAVARSIKRNEGLAYLIENLKEVL